MNARASLIVLMFLSSSLPIRGGDLSKQDQQALEKAFPKAQEFFMIPPYLEGGGRGFITYNIHANAPPELKSPGRAGYQPDLRLLRGDKVLIQKVDAKGDYFEIIVKTVAWKTVYFSPKDKLYGAIILGFPGAAAMKGDAKLQPEVKLRFFGTSAEEVQALVAQFLSEKQPSFDLKPGMSPDEVLKVLGDPSEIINFGNKKTFRYANKEVIFVDEKLADVVFGDTGAKK